MGHICTNAADFQSDRIDAPGQARGMSRPTKSPKTGRAFLLRLVAEDGPEEAARTLRDLADEIEWLAETESLQDHPMIQVADDSRSRN